VRAGEGAAQAADALPSGLIGALCGFALEPFVLGEDLFDGIGAVWWQEQELETQSASAGNPQSSEP